MAKFGQSLARFFAGASLVWGLWGLCVCAPVPSFVRSMKELHVKSLHQRVVDKTKYIFDGAVEMVVDQKFHLWADHVELDRAHGTLTAKKIDQGPVSLENEDFVILADQLFLNFNQKTGYADNINIHVDEGYLSASHAEKRNEIDWYMENMVYTPCDEEEPHWHFKAQRAMMHGSYLIKASNLVFKIGKVPVFMTPRMVLPIAGQSKSGFLIPKFSYDPKLGFGVKQEYYWHIHRHCDTTLAVDWRERRGLMFLDEFRWARAPENFTQANFLYGVERRTSTEKKRKIIEATSHHYWITGKDFRTIQPFFGFDHLSSLARIDFGTDKHIGYTLANSLDDVDNSFYNSWIFRSWQPRDLVECKFDNTKTTIKTFKIHSKGTHHVEEKERDDQVNICFFPRLDWNTTNKTIGAGINYRHDFLFDQAFYRQKETEKVFLNSQLVSSQKTIPFDTVSMLRLDYTGNVSRVFNHHDTVFKLFGRPHVQFRSHVEHDNHHHKNVLEHEIFGQGSYRVFFDCGSELSLPELTFYTDDYKYTHYFQPTLTWAYLPKFYQKDWFYIDRYDRAYPKNEIALNLRNNIVIGALQGELQINQGVDFYKQQDLFYLRRGFGGSHILPLSGLISLGGDPFIVSLGQEYDWRKARLIQSELHATLFFSKFHIGMGYLFQNRKMQGVRHLLSNIPQFLTINLAVPLSKQTTLVYDSQFYSETDKHFAQWSNVKPLLHRIRLDYSGHCWGGYAGFEQKRYRECGVNKFENLFVFALRLDSLGSFAKKFRGLPTIKRMDGQ